MDLKGVRIMGSFVRRFAAIFGLVGALTLGPSAPALAGGWAVVTLDALPDGPRAGQTLHLGFMVRQHGVTPTNLDGFGGQKPFLSARNKETGETIKATARQEGPVGHFVVDVTFPAAGAWEWEITPAPFPTVTKLGTLTVLPPLAAPGRSASAGTPALANVRKSAPAILRATGGALLLVALALVLMGGRGAPAPARRLRPVRPR
ncbi:MAG: hypothetical protein AVDCRST_MAG88-1425 [uncultured Thermomicrobiales bacterium]|uniref:YtkA-like domain-containing protein n=1 Tax=uncultured Thermomicrobiales bacterium TaxID=1645740 RepID=A0A6J4UUC8_9BACT|nr:MAG: hypothetical protein AVDCRST_MAG88-1425 [uncultured Thermomicrobiales bacterium]